MFFSYLKYFFALKSVISIVADLCGCCGGAVRSIALFLLFLIQLHVIGLNLESLKPCFSQSDKVVADGKAKSDCFNYSFSLFPHSGKVK